MNINLTDEQINTLLKNVSADTMRKILSYLIEYFDDRYDSIGANIVRALISMPSDKLTPELKNTAKNYISGSLNDGEEAKFLSYNPIANSVKYEVIDSTNNTVKYTSYICL